MSRCNRWCVHALRHRCYIKQTWRRRHLALNQQVQDVPYGGEGGQGYVRRWVFERGPTIGPGEMWWAMMALSLMVECNDVRLAEWPAHSLYFTGTKWIDLWVLPTWCSRSLGELQAHRHREGLDTWQEGKKKKKTPLEFTRLAGRNLLRLLKNFICVRGWWKTVIWLVWILTPQPTVITGFFFFL